jgi:hypothetical protein
MLAGAAGMSTASAPAVRADTSGSPDQVGRWTAPFEEHGATPRCVRGGDGRIACKPDGAYQGVLKDGRVLYWNAIESDENVQVASGTELSPETRNSSSRVLDLRAGTPAWFSPAHVDGGGRNPNIRAGDQCQGSDPMGIAGVPGRPGDGFVGSLVGGGGTGTGGSGSATGIEHNPTCSPDRPAAQNNSGDMFCSDMANMPNGNIMSVGGTDWYNEPGDGIDRDHGFPYDVGAVELEGLRNARMFNPSTNDWVELSPMKYGRWYPSLVVLGDGRIVVAGGVTKLIKSTQLGQVRRTETFDPATNAWTENYVGPESENELPLMARLHLMPDGKIFYGGSGQMWGPAGEAIDEPLMTLMQFFDPSTKKWSVVGPNPIPGRSGDYSIMLPMRPPYDTARIFAYGGTVGVPPGGELATPFTQLYTIKGDSVDVQRGPDMHHARWFNAGVMLPTGKVLALNGADKDEVIDPGSEIPVRQTDLYDPETNTWTEMAPEARDRTYHNSAVLLPDGRVLSGGHSPIPAHYGHHGDVIPGVTANNNKDSSFQIWSPPYLFYGVTRPHITYAPSAVTWGQRMTVRVDDASSIDKVILYRSPTSQHVLSNNNRLLELAFSKGADNHTLTATVPSNANVATPGPYMIFVNRTSPKGEVPSVAAMTMVGSTSSSTPAVIPMADSTVGSGIGASPPGASGPQQGASMPGNLPVPSAKPGVSYVSEFVSVPQALSSRLAGFLRQEGAGQPVAVVALLTALGLGLGIRTRRWLTRHTRD